MTASTDPVEGAAIPLQSAARARRPGRPAASPTASSRLLGRPERHTRWPLWRTWCAGGLPPRCSARSRCRWRFASFIACRTAATPSRALGLALVIYTLWLGGTAGLLPFSAGSTVLVLRQGLAVAGVWLYARERKAINGWIRSCGSYVLWCEAVFALAIVLVALLRSYQPAIAGTETVRLDYNAVTRSADFAPTDPWLAGKPMAYYYGGYVGIGALPRVTATPGVPYRPRADGGARFAGDLRTGGERGGAAADRLRNYRRLAARGRAARRGAAACDRQPRRRLRACGGARLALRASCTPTRHSAASGPRMSPPAQPALVAGKLLRLRLAAHPPRLRLELFGVPIVQLPAGRPAPTHTGAAIQGDGRRLCGCAAAGGRAAARPVVGVEGSRCICSPR